MGVRSYSSSFCRYFLHRCKSGRDQASGADVGLSAAARMLGLAMGVNVVIAYDDHAEAQHIYDDAAPCYGAYRIFQRSCDACHSTLFASHGANAMKYVPSTLTSYHGEANNDLNYRPSYLSSMLQKEAKGIESYIDHPSVPRGVAINHEVTAISMLI